MSDGLGREIEALIAAKRAIAVMRQVVRKSCTSWPVEPVIVCILCGDKVPEIKSPHHANCTITRGEQALNELAAVLGRRSPQPEQEREWQPHDICDQCGAHKVNCECPASSRPAAVSPQDECLCGVVADGIFRATIGGAPTINPKCPVHGEAAVSPQPEEQKK